MADEPQAPRRTLTLDEALSIAVRLQQEGKLDAAAEVHRRLLAVAPDHPDVLHFAGVLAHQQGRRDEAVSLIRRSLALKPDQAGWYSNLGIVLKERGELDEAADAYRSAIRLAPDQPAAHHDLGLLLAATDRADEAVRCYCRALTLNPTQPGTRTLLARSYYILGEREKAVALYERWLREEPGNPEALHMLAACSGRDVPARATDGYVERTFDAFASSFEAKLASLEYRAPQLVAAALAESGLEPAKRLAALDAGCGTGLCGPLLAPYAARLVGVDLSAGMLRLAKEKGVYDELVKTELTAYLQAQPGAYDVVVSADTLVYFGDLEAVLSAAARALRPGGLLAFTVEELKDGDDPYRLEPHGRYSHRREYVAGLLAGAGLDARITGAELRMEAGSPVPGLVVRARRAEPSAAHVAGG